MAAFVADDRDNFKAVFKKYKRRDRAPDLTAVVDVDRSTNISLNIVVHVKPSSPVVTQMCGMRPPQQWEIYHFLHHKGFYLIRNPFLPGYQHYWVARCLQDLPLPPNVTNLRVHPDVDPQTLWSNFVSHHHTGEPFDNSSPLRKLRWTTIGYHYNWDTKEYREEDYTPFPADLAILAQYVAQVLGFCHFQAEAGIINYYHLDSTLAGHTDHSELDHDAPLISISFGQDAIFLLGGPTKATEPTPILLRSGDICVMSGPARLAYHAVPRILHPSEAAAPDCFDLSTKHLEEAAKGSKRNREGPGGYSEQSCSCGENKGLLVREEHSSIAVGSAGGGDCWDCRQRSHQHAIPCPCPQREQKHEVRSSQHNNRPSDNSGGSKSLQKDSCWGTEDASSPSLDKNHSCQGVFSNLLSDAKHNIPDKPETQTSPEESLVNEVNKRIAHTLLELDWEPFATYLSSSRLNVNIRQVLKPGQTFQSHVQAEGVQSTQLCAGKES